MFKWTAVGIMAFLLFVGSLVAYSTAFRWMTDTVDASVLAGIVLAGITVTIDAVFCVHTLKEIAKCSQKD